MTEQDTDQSEFMVYQGVKLVKKDAEVLILLEKEIGEPISITNFTEENSRIIRLDLWGNQLTALPDSIGKLTSLQELYLHNNQLAAVPDTIGKLTSLQKLYLSNNKLTALPESIEKLTNLQIFSLWSNQLTALPESIGKLTSLQILRLRDNQLTALPVTTWEFFSKIANLDLKNNSFNITAFKQLWRKTQPGDEVFRDFLEAVTYQIFSEEERRKLRVITGSESKILSVTQKTKHDVFLNVGNSITRTFYFAFIGLTAILKLNTDQFGIILNLGYFVLLLSLLGAAFFFINWLSSRQENKLKKQRKIYVTRATKWLFQTDDQFEQLLNDRYFIPQLTMTSSRYKTGIGFMANLLIAGVTTLIFLFFPSDSGKHEAFEIVVLFTIGIILGSIIRIFYYAMYQLPNLRENLTQEFNEYLTSYENKWEEKFNKEKKEEQRNNVIEEIDKPQGDGSLI